MRTLILIPLLLFVAVAAGAADVPAPVPLVARYSMEVRDGKLVDSGPFGYDAAPGKAQPIAEGRRGPGLRFEGRDAVVRIQGDSLNRTVAALTLTGWAKFDRFPARDSLYLFGKGYNTGFQFALSTEGRTYIHGNWGGGWYHGGWGAVLPKGEWVHLALTLQKGEKARTYVNGKQVAEMDTPFAVWPVNDPFLLGNGDWAGALDEVSVYAAALTPEQIATEMAGTLPTRKPADADYPVNGYPVRAALARFDLPAGFRDFDGRVKQSAQRVPGPDAVDWPQLWLSDGTPLFRDSAEQNLEVPLAQEPRNRPLFRQPYDPTIEPVGHWLRALPWIWGQHYVYTTDRTARTGSGDYELWAFPVRISGTGETPIWEVALSLDGRTLYERREALHTLTLLLPANLNGKPYELRVNGQAPARFDVGLAPVEGGKPEETPLKVDLNVPGGIRVASLERPETFPNRKEWEDDLKRLADGSGLPATLPVVEQAASFTRHLGVDVPRSPVTVNLFAMSAGMSGGTMFGSDHIAAFNGTPAEYAAHLARLGFDRDFETIHSASTGDSKGKYDALCVELAKQGVQAAFNATGYGSGAMLGCPNQAFYSYNLPEWHRPLYRDHQILAQRFRDYPNLGGILTGADNAGYVPYWDWAPPIPNRPWGRAFVQFQGGAPLQVPVGPTMRVGKPHEVKAPTHAAFLDFIRRYDETFQQYGYFARAVREVLPQTPFVTGSFGSSPGVGGRGGWPWATIPGKPMHRDLPILQVYDWNELSSSKPMHNVALLDRLQSYYPEKPAWSIIDDFKLLFGREARQRAYALVLTRGVQAVGTNFLAHSTGGEPGRDKIVAEQRELFSWIHRYGGAYSMMKPLPAIGILYVHEQAISRGIVGGDNPDAKDLYAGSHEGKTTEALFLCHAAGWPAKIITPEELQRGLPLSIKAILLVGLNRFDSSWVWYTGLEKSLQAFTQAGGRVLVDDESVSPVPATRTGMKVASYVIQSEKDVTPLLLQRNAENIERLRRAMQRLQPALALSNDPTVWAVPSQAGDTLYLTVANQGFVEGQNASRVVKPQQGKLTWLNIRPIYDVRARKRVTAAQASTVDLTHDGFQWYALPPAPVVAPQVKVSPGPDGFYRASVIIANPKRTTGIPVSLTVRRGRESATVYSATGLEAKLPLSRADGPGHYTVTATELLSGLSSAAAVDVAPVRATPAAPTTAPLADASAVRRFARRSDVPLVVALTAQQVADPAVKALGERLVRFYTARGRKARLGAVAPDDVVVSLQPGQPILHYPQWQTVDADLVLLGNPRNNLLILDQARGYLLPAGTEKLPAGKAVVAHTWSPFVGERNVVNVLAADAAGLAAGVGTLEQTGG